ncbi:hypothetical protein V5O48_017486, partial [Marasmius crinis-equi]
MPGSHFFGGAAGTGISGAPNFTSTGRDSTQHITNYYYNSTVNQYYSGPPPLIVQPRPPVDDDVNGSEPDQRQTTTTRSPPNGQAPSNGLSREEEHVERPGGDLEQVDNSPADGNGLEM